MGYNNFFDDITDRNKSINPLALLLLLLALLGNSNKYIPGSGEVAGATGENGAACPAGAADATGTSDMELIKLDKIISNFIDCPNTNIPKYFTQFNVYDNLSLAEEYYNREIETTNVVLKINSGKIINTIQGVSIEGQYLTGKKLILLGTLNTKIFLKCHYDIDKYYSLEKKIPFSCFIIVPQDICKGQIINLRYLIEDITTAVLTKNKVFVSITLLIQYIDEY